MVQRRKKREATSAEKIAKFVKAATTSQSSVAAAIMCGFTTKDASADDQARGANSWESTYSTLRRNYVDKLVAGFDAVIDGKATKIPALPVAQAEALGLKKFPACVWGGGSTKSVAETYGMTEAELKALAGKSAK